jgi:hypothetical protein
MVLDGKAPDETDAARGIASKAQKDMTKLITLLVVSASLLMGCYSYYPVGPSQVPQKTPQRLPQALPLPPQSAPPAHRQPQPSPSPLPPQPAQPTLPQPSTQPHQYPDAQAEQATAAAANDCVQRIPDQAGRKAELVRCIVAGSDAVWDRADPQGAAQRHAMAAYAIQLAEREDRGEITREQAESLYQQFVQQTPGYGQAPPQQ